MPLGEEHYSEDYEGSWYCPRHQCVCCDALQLHAEPRFEKHVRMHHIMCGAVLCSKVTTFCLTSLYLPHWKFYPVINLPSFLSPLAFYIMFAITLSYLTIFALHIPSDPPSLLPPSPSPLLSLHSSSPFSSSFHYSPHLLTTLLLSHLHYTPPLSHSPSLSPSSLTTRLLSPILYLFLPL